MSTIIVPIIFEDADGLPETAGRVEILNVVADLLADGLLRMEPVYMQFESKRRLMEVRLVPAHEPESDTLALPL